MCVPKKYYYLLFSSQFPSIALFSVAFCCTPNVPAHGAIIHVSLGDANYCKSKHHVLVIGKVWGRGRWTRVWWLTSISTTCVRLQIAHIDFSAPSGNDTHGRRFESLSGLQGGFHFTRGSDERLCAMHQTKRQHITYNIHTMSDTDSSKGWPSQLQSLAFAPCTWFVHTSCLLCSMQDANTYPNGSIVAPLWLQHVFFAPSAAQNPPLMAPFAHPFFLQVSLFAPWEMQTLVAAILFHEALCDANFPLNSLPISGAFCHVTFYSTLSYVESY